MQRLQTIQTLRLGGDFDLRDAASLSSLSRKAVRPYEPSWNELDPLTVEYKR